MASRKYSVGKFYFCAGVLTFKKWQQIHWFIQYSVADTFWSVHIKCCFRQKKVKSQRPRTNIRPAERQRKGCNQSSTKNVTSKTQRLHKVAKQHKTSDQSGGNPKTNRIQTKSNKIWFRKTKSGKRGKEEKLSWRRTKKMMSWKSTEKRPINDVIKNHD